MSPLELEAPSVDQAPAPKVEPPRESVYEEEMKLDTLAEGEEDESEKARKRIPFLCRRRQCKVCRELCYRDPKKPKKSCTRILCQSFLIARAEALRFKTSNALFSNLEKKKAAQSFYFIVAQMMLFFIIGMLLPFIASFTSLSECTSVSPTYVYGAYCGYIAISTALEVSILYQLKKALSDSKQQSFELNQYLFAKWCQG